MSKKRLLFLGASVFLAVSVMTIKAQQAWRIGG